MNKEKEEESMLQGPGEYREIRKKVAFQCGICEWRKFDSLSKEEYESLDDLGKTIYFHKTDQYGWVCLDCQRFLGDDGTVSLERIVKALNTSGMLDSNFEERQNEDKDKSEDTVE